MPIDTLIAFVGTYADVDDALADYDAVKVAHVELGLIDAYDAAVIAKREDGKVKIVKKHETPTRVGGVLGAGLGLATGLVVALFPAAALGAAAVVGAGTGGVLGAVAGHAAAGMSRDDLKELGEQLDAGRGGSDRGRRQRHRGQDRGVPEEGREGHQEAGEGRPEGAGEGRRRGAEGPVASADREPARSRTGATPGAPVRRLASGCGVSGS